MEINSYNQIQIDSDSFVIFDIDETLIYFDNINPKWWKDTYDKYYALYADYDKADSLSLEEWIQLINFSTPKAIDICGFNKLSQKIYKFDNSKIIFLTARDQSLKDLTFKQLIYCGFDLSKFDIYFSSDKGSLIKELRKNYPNNKIIFIDDLKSNISDVKYHNPDAECYLARFII